MSNKREDVYGDITYPTCGVKSEASAVRSAGYDLSIARKWRRPLRLISAAWTLAILALNTISYPNGHSLMRAKPAISFNESLLATIPDEFQEPEYGGWSSTFSPDGSKVAYQAKQNDKWFVVVGNKRGPDFDLISQILFSPDSNRIAYIARQDNKAFVVVGNKRGSEYELVRSPILRPDGSRLPGIDEPSGSIGFIAFSPDSSKVAFWVRKDRKGFIVVDDQMGPQFDLVGEPVFSPDSSKIAYWAMQDEKDFVVIGDKRIPQFDKNSILGQILSFSPDGKLAYLATSGKRWSIVIGDKRGPGFDEVTYPVFSPDGSKVAYGANEKNKWFIVIDDKRGLEFDKVYPLAFKPDGNRVAYEAIEGDRSFIVVEDKRWPAYGKYILWFSFSADGSKFAYAATELDKGAIVVGDKQGPQFDDVGPPVFNQDGSKVAYGARQGRRLWWKVLDVKQP